MLRDRVQPAPKNPRRRFTNTTLYSSQAASCLTSPSLSMHVYSQVMGQRISYWTHSQLQKCLIKHCSQAKASWLIFRLSWFGKLQVVRCCWSKVVFTGVIFASPSHLSKHTNDTISHEWATKHSYSDHCVFCPFHLGSSTIPSTRLPDHAEQSMEATCRCTAIHPLGASHL
jgi:hypothetical protein